MRRSFLAVVIAACSVAVIAPATSSAATTVGQTGPSVGCSPASTGNVQDLVAGPPTYQVPTDGVITSWSATESTAGKQTKLLVLRPVSGTTFNVVAKSALETWTAGDTETFATQIPVQAGELIGNWGEICAVAGTPGDQFHFFTGADPATGADQAFASAGTNGFRLNLSANLEPDCNHNGLGDETQDPGAAAACNPPASNGQGNPTSPINPAGNVRKRKCKKAKRHSASAAKKKKCKRRKRSSAVWG